MSKTALVSERIAILEEKFGKSGNQLGLDAGVGNGTVGGWTDNLIEKPSLAVKQFLRHYKVRPEWWKTGEGEISITHTHNEAAIPQNMEDKEEIYSRLVEGNSDYRLIPKTVLEGKYVIVLESQAGQLVKAYEIALKGRQELIETLKEEIRELRSSSKVAK